MDPPPTLDAASAHESRLLALSPDLLGAADFDGCMQLVNPAWGATLGWSDEELRSMGYLELVHPQDRGATAAVIARLAGGGTVQDFVCRVRQADGGERSILWSAHGSVEDGCFYLVGKDVTERRRLEDELASRAHRLERANSELQDFAYVASHDLAEPLRMITSYLELLQRRHGDQLDETAHEFIGYAVGGATRMRRLIDDLLTYSRVGSDDLERAEVDVEELVADVLQRLERAIEESGATVEVRRPLASACGDRSQLCQLLQNLVANAVKFRAADRPPVVTLSAVEEEGGTSITVTDNGIGIPSEHHDRIFKMFARPHARDAYEGTGIGLALCRRIAERHGGRIALESEPGTGSTFRVWLPQA